MQAPMNNEDFHHQFSSQHRPAPPSVPRGPSARPYVVDNATADADAAAYPEVDSSDDGVDGGESKGDAVASTSAAAREYRHDAPPGSALPGSAPPGSSSISIHAVAGAKLSAGQRAAEMRTKAEEKMRQATEKVRRAKEKAREKVERTKEKAKMYWLKATFYLFPSGVRAQKALTKTDRAIFGKFNIYCWHWSTLVRLHAACCKEARTPREFAKVLLRNVGMEPNRLLERVLVCVWEELRGPSAADLDDLDGVMGVDGGGGVGGLEGEDLDDAVGRALARRGGVAVARREFALGLCNLLACGKLSLYALVFHAYDEESRGSLTLANLARMLHDAWGPRPSSNGKRVLGELTRMVAMHSQQSHKAQSYLLETMSVKSVDPSTKMVNYFDTASGERSSHLPRVLPAPQGAGEVEALLQKNGMVSPAAFRRYAHSRASAFWPLLECQRNLQRNIIGVWWWGRATHRIDKILITRYAGKMDFYEAWMSMFTQQRGEFEET